MVAPDLVGRGKSTYFRDPEMYTIETNLRCLQALSKYAGKVNHFIGTSWGGAILMYFLYFGKSWLLSLKKKYNQYDGFVILHGTDTMAYTASALSYMLENLSKPVILTGSQLPLGVIRTDAKRNLITTVEIAASKTIVPEVCIYFNNQLFRGNRAEKCDQH